MNYRSSLLTGALVAAGILVSSPSSAQMTNGLYIAGGAGANWLRDSKTSQLGVDRTYSFETGDVEALALGWGLGNGFRFEGELARRNSDVENTNGDFHAYSLMFNGLYDFNLGLPVVPYLGLGIGAARVSANSVPVTGTTRTIDDHDVVLAYQGIAGLAYALTDSLKLDLSYRYMDTQHPKFQDSAGIDTTSRYRDHALLLSVRYEFGAPRQVAQPAPAPVPAAAPAPAPAPVAAAPAPAPIQRSYLVFFDFNKSDITPEALRVIQQAATNARSGNVSRIQATGHADRSGPDRYNMALSIRRANAVKSELMRAGVPENQIAVIGKGETEPLVPTADGVREPQNRRVEILLQ
jgi:OOP family OmpA-OmpF porin